MDTSKKVKQCRGNACPECGKCNDWHFENKEWHLRQSATCRAGHHDYLDDFNYCLCGGKSYDPCGCGLLECHICRYAYTRRCGCRDRNCHDCRGVGCGCHDRCLCAEKK